MWWSDKVSVAFWRQLPKPDFPSANQDSLLSFSAQTSVQKVLKIFLFSNSKAVPRPGGISTKILVSEHIALHSFGVGFDNSSALLWKFGSPVLLGSTAEVYGCSEPFVFTTPSFVLLRWKYLRSPHCLSMWSCSSRLVTSMTTTLGIWASSTPRRRANIASVSRTVICSMSASNCGQYPSLCCTWERKTRKGISSERIRNWELFVLEFENKKQCYTQPETRIQDWQRT